MSPWGKSVEKLFSDEKLHLGKSKSVCNVEKLICEYWNTNKWSSFYMSVLVKFHCIIFRQLLCYIFFVTAGTFRYIFKFRIYLTTFDLHLSHLHLMVVQVAWQSLRSMQLHTLCNILLYFVILAQYNLKHFFNKQSSKARKLFNFCFDNNIHSACDFILVHVFSP